MIRRPPRSTLPYTTLFRSELARVVVQQGRFYGHSRALAGQKINLEFVSANPTGPVHLGHTRWAAVGDSLGRILAADRKSTRLNSSHANISYAVFCLKKTHH